MFATEDTEDTEQRLFAYLGDKISAVRCCSHRSVAAYERCMHNKKDDQHVLNATLRA